MLFRIDLTDRRRGDHRRQVRVAEKSGGGTADRAGKPGESASYANQRYAILSLGWRELDSGLRP